MSSNTHNKLNHEKSNVGTNDSTNFFFCAAMTIVKATAQTMHVRIILLVVVILPPNQSAIIMMKVTIPRPTGNPKPMRSVNENFSEMRLTMKKPARKSRINAIAIMA